MLCDIMNSELGPILLVIPLPAGQLAMPTAKTKSILLYLDTGSLAPTGVSSDSQVAWKKRDI